MQKCWICNNNEANSGEHKIKASEIRKLMGGKKFDGFYKDDNGFVDIKTSKDKVLKFPKIICNYCNNEVTKLADDAYNKFVTYIIENYDEIKALSRINFRKIYGTNWKQKKIDLYRYVVKHAGCKSHDDYGNKLIDLSKLSAFILGKDSIENFQLFFQINDVVKLVRDVLKGKQINQSIPSLFLGNGATVPSHFENNKILFGSIIHEYLRIEWIIADKIKQVDFNKEFEDIEVLDFDFYPNYFGDYVVEDDNRKVFEYLIFGKFQDFDSQDWINYIFEKFKQIYIKEII